MSEIKIKHRLPLLSCPVDECHRKCTIVPVHHHVHSGKVTKRVRLRSKDLVGNDVIPHRVERRDREYGVA